MKRINLLCFVLSHITLFAQDSTSVKAPFAGMDLTWVNGQSRISDPPLVFKNKQGEVLLTASAYCDVYYNYDFANPVDNTHTISSSIGRHNEFTTNLASIGIETGYKNIIGRVWLQWGAMQHIIQESDGSVNKGRNTGTGNLKFIREAAAGYHFDLWHGLNIEAGIFISYIGLESYMLQDNWSYQRSMVCDFTPFYFQGTRVQAYPSANIKTELWLLNGWQAYNSFGSSPGFGSSTYWRPNENLQLAANFYVGRDTQTSDTTGAQSGRLRFHHDNSVVARYHKDNSSFISQCAFSINTHYGFQSGTDMNDPAIPESHFMTGTSIAHRVWLANNKYALTLRGDYLANKGHYLAFVPSPVTPNAYTEMLSSEPEKPLELFQFTATFDLMPNDYFTFRLEYGYRCANMPYFVGQQGTTSPSGWTNIPLPPDWKPDLQKTEHRFTAVTNFRL